MKYSLLQSNTDHLGCLSRAAESVYWPVALILYTKCLQEGCRSTRMGQNRWAGPSFRCFDMWAK